MLTQLTIQYNTIQYFTLLTVPFKTFFTYNKRQYSLLTVRLNIYSTDSVKEKAYQSYRPFF